MCNWKTLTWVVVTGLMLFLASLIFRRGIPDSRSDTEIALGQNGVEEVELSAVDRNGLDMMEYSSDRDIELTDSSDAARADAALIDHDAAVSSPPRNRDIDDSARFFTPSGAPLAVNPLDEILRSMATELSDISGELLRSRAVEMLRSESSNVGIMALSSLIGAGIWDAEIASVASKHEDRRVLLHAWRELRDAGKHEEAFDLQDELMARSDEAGEWLREIAGENELPASVTRGLLDASRLLVSDEERRVITEEILRQSSVDYAGRMAALLELRQLTEFGEFRDLVHAHLTRGESATDRIWISGLERLSERLEGPDDMPDVPMTWQPHDIDIFLAEDYPTMFEDMALLIEDSLIRDTGLFGIGVRDRLSLLETMMDSVPLSLSEKNALRRILVMREHIVEADLSHIPWAGRPGE